MFQFVPANKFKLPSINVQCQLKRTIISTIGFNIWDYNMFQMFKEVILWKILKNINHI